MVLFLTSSMSFAIDEELELYKLNEQNGFVDQLHQVLPHSIKILYIVSFPKDYEITDYYADRMRKMYEKEFDVLSFTILDARNQEYVKDYMKDADLIILSGGHVPTQNAFFKDLHLKKMIQDFDGVVIGASAGSMNAADEVYAQPELEGEAISKIHKRFIEGLGLTNIQILPHYHELKDMSVDGYRSIEDLAIPDSKNHCFYAIPDGSYILCKDGTEVMYGESYQIKEEKMELFCRENEQREIK